MKRRKVESSLLVSVGYDPKERVLEVEVRQGQVYQYFEVPEIVYWRLLAARSLGVFFNAEVRDVYVYKQISPGR